ncbi:MAG TPA: DUF4294 domain-containing protein [Bacteroidales bacterium]|nr:DUF4294 domain-containing protein [Bacteroidales bacterium]
MSKIGFILLTIFTNACLVYADNGHPQKDSFSEKTSHDTIFNADIQPVYIYSPRTFKESEKNELLRYQRLVYNVKKAYPFAKIAAQKLREVNENLRYIKTKKEKEAYIARTEDEMKKQFENDLKKLTITQGKILIKLFYRETGSTTYEVVKELRGSFEAFFWQALARLFGSSLKTKYDPLGEDADIEMIVQLIESGQL